MNNRNLTCSMNHVNDVYGEESSEHVLYNLNVIKDICKKSRYLQSTLRQNDSRVRVFVNQLIVQRSERSGNLRILQSTIKKDGDRLSVTSLPRPSDSMVPHYLFLIGIENYGSENNGHAIGAIVRDKRIYIFNPANMRKTHSIYRSYGDVISEKSTYRKVSEMLGKMLNISVNNTFVYTGRNLQEANGYIDYSVSCTLFSEYFLLHPFLYKTLNTPIGFTISSDTQRLFDRIQFNREQIRERTKQLPKKFKSPSLNFGALRLVQKRKRSRSKSYRSRKRYKI